MPKLRLKDLRLNQVPFYYQTYDGTVDEVDEDGNLTGRAYRSIQIRFVCLRE